MTVSSVTVVIPTLNGGDRLLEVVDAVVSQQTMLEFELLIVDSSSTDGAPDEAAARGARLHRIRREEFGHGRTRNLAASLSRADVVAYLSQDAVPASPMWLETIVDPLMDSGDVVATFGRQLAPSGTHPWVVAGLDRVFTRLSPDGSVRVQRLDGQQPLASRDVLRATFFSNVNSAVRRRHLETFPFTDLAWAEDRRLAWDLLVAGYGIAYAPGAAVWHAHDLGLRDTFRRARADERGLRNALPAAVCRRSRLRVALGALLPLTSPPLLRSNRRQILGSAGRGLAAAAGTLAAGVGRAPHDPVTDNVVVLPVDD